MASSREFFGPDRQHRDPVLVWFDFAWHSDDHDASSDETKRNAGLSARHACPSRRNSL
jgi:hypothetical protein